MSDAASNTYKNDLPMSPKNNEALSCLSAVRKDLASAAALGL